MPSVHFLSATDSIVADRPSDKSAQFHRNTIASAVLIVATGVGLVACGGGGGTSTSPTPVTLSGQAVKGPVMGGQVCAYTLETPRKQIACATTGLDAKYSLALPQGTGEVLLEVTGGTYVDEATGKTVALTDPLRTISKAGSADNALITPFTELAIQRASASNPGGNLSLVGFQTQIGQLETGLGITGLATGNPFSGKTPADQKYAEALTAFSKQQNGSGKSVGDTLSILGSQIDKCGISSVNATLSAYGNASLSSAGSAGGGSKLQSLANVSTSSDLTIVGSGVSIDNYLPSPCIDSLQVDGQAANFADLYLTTPPTSWSTATNVEITLCQAPASSLNAVFPSAQILMHIPSDTLNSSNLISKADSLSIGGGAINLVGAVQNLNNASLNLTGGSLVTLTGSNIDVNAGVFGLGSAALNLDGTASLSLSGGSLVLRDGGSLNLAGGSLNLNSGSLSTNGGSLAFSGGLLVTATGASVSLSGGSLNVGAVSVSPVGVNSAVTISSAPTSIILTPINTVTLPGLIPLSSATAGFFVDSKGCLQSLSLGTGVGVTAGSGSGSIVLSGGGLTLSGN
jgi:hypothetical protein